ncbi:hypothetical protein [Streptomyces sp. NPDC048516]|uniref:hypothetical protein n=1 Tax=Streptomyces sp. NPDC048516 TaxID=3365565 RepID=UPI003717F8C0
MGPHTRGADPVVDSVATSVYRAPIDAAEGDGTLTWDSTTMIVAQASSGTTTGLGCTSGPRPPPRSSTSSRRPRDRPLRDGCARRRRGDVPGRAQRRPARPGLVAGALSAVDIALWDLKARLLQVPLVGLMGASGTEVPV